MFNVPENRAPTHIVYMDTEFTSLTGEPLLLSVGVVGGGLGDPEFYAEVTDEAHLEAASTFASNVVLPQFGRVGGAACAYVELGARVTGFLEGTAVQCQDGRRLSVAFESDRDWALLEAAVRCFDAQRWFGLRTRLQPINVYNTPGFAAGERAAHVYFDSQRLEPISRHHALCDARALRLSCEAAAASTSGHARWAPTMERAGPYRPSSARAEREGGPGSRAPGLERA